MTLHKHTRPDNQSGITPSSEGDWSALYAR